MHLNELLLPNIMPFEYYECYNCWMLFAFSAHKVLLHNIYNSIKWFDKCAHGTRFLGYVSIVRDRYFNWNIEKLIIHCNNESDWLQFLYFFLFRKQKLHTNVLLFDSLNIKGIGFKYIKSYGARTTYNMFLSKYERIIIALYVNITMSVRLINIYSNTQFFFITSHLFDLKGTHTQHNLYTWPWQW